LPEAASCYDAKVVQAALVGVGCESGDTSALIPIVGQVARSLPVPGVGHHGPDQWTPGEERYDWTVTWEKTSLAPRKGDLLFRAGNENPDAVAHLRATDNPGFAYSLGYRRAAQAMAQHARDRSSWEAGFLVFPVAFLYRHYIELMLKELIIKGSFLADHELTTVERRHLKKHRLDLLWTILKPIAKSEGSLPSDDLDGIGHYINELNQVDPESQSFRYALSSKDESILEAIPYIDIEVFVGAMERLCDSFELLDGQLEVSSDHKQEMLAYQASFEAEMRAEHESEMQQQQAEYEAEMRAEYESGIADQQAEYEAETRHQDGSEG
jgi:hypothetical protein